MTLHSSIRQVVPIVGVLVKVLVKADLVAPTNGAGMKHFAIIG